MRFPVLSKCKKQKVKVTRKSNLLYLWSQRSQNCMVYIFDNGQDEKWALAENYNEVKRIILCISKGFGFDIPFLFFNYP